MTKDHYIRSLHYCPMCGMVVGCGEGGCNSQQFQDHILNCRLATKENSGRIRFTDKDEGKRK